MHFSSPQPLFLLPLLLASLAHANPSPSPTPTPKPYLNELDLPQAPAPAPHLHSLDLRQAPAAAAPAAPAAAVPAPAAPVAGVGGGAQPAAAQPAPGAAANPVTSVMVQTVIAGVTTQVLAPYTQTFGAAGAGGAAPSVMSGSIGLGTLTGEVGVVKTSEARAGGERTGGKVGGWGLGVAVVLGGVVGAGGLWVGG